MKPRIDVLGVQLNVLDLSTAVEEMDALIAAGQRGYVSTCPAYTVMLGHERADVRAALNGATWATADGVPVAWAQRLLGGQGARRVYGPDLMLALCARSAARGYRQFYFGGAPGVAADLARRLEARFPGLQTAGLLCPPFRALTASEEEDMIAGLNAAQADIIWVGLGSPKQDLWMAQYRARLTAPLLIGVGAAFDFLTERKPQAPRALREAGLEWLFRLVSEPRRLWRRYVLYNPKFVLGLARQWWAQRAGQ